MQYGNISFDASTVAAMTQEQWIEHYKGKLGCNPAEEINELKVIHAKCTEEIKAAAPDPVPGKKSKKVTDEAGK